MNKPNTYREKIMGDAKRLIKETPFLSAEDKRKITQLSENLVTKASQSQDRGLAAAEKETREKLYKIIRNAYFR